MKKAHTMVELLVVTSIISSLTVATYTILSNFKKKYGEADYQLIHEFEEEYDIKLPYSNIEIETVDYENLEGEAE